MPIDDIKSAPPSHIHNAVDGNRVKGNNDQAAESARQDAPPPGPSSSGTDTVNLTHTAQQLHRVEQSVASTPVVDSQRVEAVKKALADGTYQIDPERIAQKLAAFENVLTGDVRKR